MLVGGFDKEKVQEHRVRCPGATEAAPSAAVANGGGEGGQADFTTGQDHNGQCRDPEGDGITTGSRRQWKYLVGGPLSAAARTG